MYNYKQWRNSLPCLLSFWCAAGCGKSPSEKLTSLSEDFVYASLAFSPSSATAAGLHQYQKQNLDDMLDDFSAQSLSRQRTFYEKFSERLAGLNTANLTPEDRADLAIIQDQISLNLLDLTEIHSHLHSPQLYVETLGNALFAPYVLEYAPKPDRIRHIIARLQKVPLYLDQASTNLVASPALWTQVAAGEQPAISPWSIRRSAPAFPADLSDAYARAARSRPGRHDQVRQVPQEQSERPRQP